MQNKFKAKLNVRCATGLYFKPTKSSQKLFLSKHSTTLPMRIHVHEDIGEEEVLTGVLILIGDKVDEFILYRESGERVENYTW